MAITFKVLAAGALTSSETALYPAAGPIPNKMAVVTNIRFINKDTQATATITLRVLKDGTGTPRYIAPYDLQLRPRETFIFEEEITLYVASGPDTVRASAVGTANVDYVINGIERDI